MNKGTLVDETRGVFGCTRLRCKICSGDDEEHTLQYVAHDTILVTCNKDPYDKTGQS